MYIISLLLKRKIHYPFKWIQLIEWSNYLNMNSRLHLSNKLKECGKFLWIRLWNLCFISMKESIFSCRLQACIRTKLSSFISIFKGFSKYVTYLALWTTRSNVFKKYVLPSGHTTSLQCHKTSYDDLWLMTPCRCIDSFNDVVCPPVNLALMLI